MSHQYWLGLGSNLGDRGAALQAAIDAFADADIAVEAVSAVYETAPQDLADQPPFLNAAVRVRTPHDPPQILPRLKAIEAARGRTPGGVRFGPRPIDCDVLLWSGGTWHDAQLEIPHPRLLRRRFAMAGIVEVDPDVRLPDGTLLATHFAAIPAADQPVARLPGDEVRLHW